MYDSKTLKMKLYKRGWRQYWGRGYDKWVYKSVIDRLDYSELWKYAIKWREALMIEYKRQGVEKCN